MHYLNCCLLVLCLLAGFSYAGTWIENFDDGNTDGWRLVLGSEKHAEATVVNSELVFRQFNIGSTGGWLVLEASRNWSNYTLEMRFKFTEDVGPNDPKGAIITYNDTFDGIPEGGPNCPFLFLRPDGLVRGMLAINGAWFFPVTTQFPFSSGVWYQLRILVQGSHYELFIDGQHILTYDDDTFTSGGVGIGARDVVVHFDDVRITGDSVPDGGSVAVEVAGKLATVWAALK